MVSSWRCTNTNQGAPSATKRQPRTQLPRPSRSRRTRTRASAQRGRGAGGSRRSIHSSSRSSPAAGSGSPSSSARRRRLLKEIFHPGRLVASSSQGKTQNTAAGRHPARRCAAAHCRRSGVVLSFRSSTTALFKERSMRTRLLSLALCVAAAAPAQADVVTDWTGELLESVRVLRPAPPVASRQMALTTTAMFDAVNGVVGAYRPYNVSGSGDPEADAAAAAATAAHDVLAYLYPARRAHFASRLASDLAAIPDGPAKSLGLAWGGAVAAQAMAARDGDGAATALSYEPPEGAGWWAPTPPAYQEIPALPHWGGVRPWGVERAARFRPPVPPSLRSRCLPGRFPRGLRARRERQHAAHRRPDRDCPLLGGWPGYSDASRPLARDRAPALRGPRTHARRERPPLRPAGRRGGRRRDHRLGLEVRLRLLAAGDRHPLRLG